MTETPLISGLIGLLSALLVFLYSRFGYLVANSEPNERSSHGESTPSGAGIVFAVLVTVGSAIATAGSEQGLRFFTFSVIGILVSFLGLADDRYSISPGIRLVVQFGLACALCIILGTYEIFGTSQLFSFVGLANLILTALIITAAMNLYNFMDGIDGLASLQAVFAATALAIILGLDGHLDLSLLMGITASSCLGFLFFNWQRARVFMGDAGSLFLGYLFAAGPLLLPKSSGGYAAITAWILFPMLFDSIFTLARRLFSKARFWTAHREHLYQRIADLLDSHWKVALLYGAITAALGLSAIFSTPKSNLTKLAPILLIVGIVPIILFLFAGRQRGNG
jgi:Fuc2NAc and GlcNAc transferase